MMGGGFLDDGRRLSGGGCLENGRKLSGGGCLEDGRKLSGGGCLEDGRRLSGGDQPPVPRDCPLAGCPPSLWAGLKKGLLSREYIGEDLLEQDI